MHSLLFFIFSHNEYLFTGHLNGLESKVFKNIDENSEYVEAVSGTIGLLTFYKFCN